MRKGLASKCCWLEVVPVSCTFPTPRTRPAVAPIAFSTNPERQAASGTTEPIELIIRVAAVDPVSISHSTAPSPVRT
jgi:hypothetical protein